VDDFAKLHQLQYTLILKNPCSSTSILETYNLSGFFSLHCMYILNSLGKQMAIAMQLDHTIPFDVCLQR
jgi:hypothetical protein